MVLLASPASLWAQPATVTEEQQVFKTYPFSGPDPSPIMTRSTIWGRGQRLYPYFSFDTLSYTPVDRTWNVVVLENRYIKVMIMPGEGGKLIGAIEKSTGKEFIYLNKVRKFRHIALRGPWTSGGIELNFGIVGHTPATATPVDYLDPQERRRQRQLHRRRHGSAVPHPVARQIHPPARQGLRRNAVAVVQPAAAQPVLLRLDERRQQDHQ